MSTEKELNDKAVKLQGNDELLSSVKDLNKEVGT